MAVKRDVWLRGILILGVGLLLITQFAMFPVVALAYDPNVHKDLTEYLATQAGINVKGARAIAAADQGTDDDPATSPWKSRNVRELYHFVTARRLSEMRVDALTSCNTKTIGQYLHALEDAYAHEGFDPVIGHIFYPQADWANLHVEKALNMARAKFLEVGEIAKSCRQLGENTSSKPWDQIKEIVRKFLATRNGKLP